MDEEGLMHRKSKYFLAVIFIFLAVNIHAEPSYFKSDVDKVTFFNKITDYFSTLGKDSNEKRRILNERKFNRRMNRLKEARDNFNNR